MTETSFYTNNCLAIPQETVPFFRIIGTLFYLVFINLAECTTKKFESDWTFQRFVETKKQRYPLILLY